MNAGIELHDCKDQVEEDKVATAVNGEYQWEQIRPSIDWFGGQ